MIALAATLSYVAIMLLVWRKLYVYGTDHKSYSNDFDDPFIAGITALAWPLVLVGFIVYQVAKHTIFRETPGQRQRRLKDEAYLIEKKAKELGLPVPGYWHPDGPLLNPYKDGQ